MARNYAALPYEYRREMRALSDAEFGRLMRALIDYSETGEEISLSGNERFYADRVMMQEDRFQESYDSMTEKKRAAGRKGAGERWKQSMADDSTAWQTMAGDSKNGYTETETNTETNIYISSNDTASKSKKFRQPTVEEVQSYCRDRGNNVDAQAFVDFYESKGWKVGKDPMKDWRAAVRTWERRDDRQPQAKKNGITFEEKMQVFRDLRDEYREAGI